jgi:hypothetical protein
MWLAFGDRPVCRTNLVLAESHTAPASDLDKNQPEFQQNYYLHHISTITIINNNNKTIDIRLLYHGINYN